MKCKKCNTENDNKNKFCIKCGAELNGHRSGTIFCPACGTEINKSDSFCADCGHNLSNINLVISSRANKKNQKRQTRKQSHVLSLNSIIKEHKLIAVAAAALFVFLIYRSLPESGEYNSTKYIPSGVKSSIVSVMSDSVTAAVVKEFNCSCGECTDPLEVCTCDTAAEERGFIKTKASEKLSVEGIITAVKNKYGAFKTTSGMNLGG